MFCRILQPICFPCRAFRILRATICQASPHLYVLHCHGAYACQSRARLNFLPWGRQFVNVFMGTKQIPYPSMRNLSFEAGLERVWWKRSITVAMGINGMLTLWPFSLNPGHFWKSQVHMILLGIWLNFTNIPQSSCASPKSSDHFLGKLGMLQARTLVGHKYEAPTYDSMTVQ